MASIFTPTSFGAALGPYAIDINDCLGDSVGIINANTNYLASYTAAVSAATNSQLATTITTLSTVPHARLNDGGQTGVAPIFGIRAWVNFDSQRNSSGVVDTTNGTNRFIKGSGNVSSVLMNAKGDYTINFGIPITDTNYGIMGTASSTNDGNAADQTAWVTIIDNQNTPKLTTSVRVGVYYSNSAFSSVYHNEISVIVIR